MKQLHFATDLALPLDAATQTFAFIGRKGSGKTYGAGKLTELLIDAGVQVIILDSVGNWFGLRIAADGRGDGIDVPIVGGLRGDVPLEPTGGGLIADVAADSGRSMVLDVSQFTKADRQRFATAFAERLWQRKKAEREPSAVHLVIEESQLIIPQDVRGDAAKMVGIYEEVIRLGRNYGIGVTMITQRPQSVSKEVLNQTECLVVFQTNGAHERKALKEWIVHQGADVTLLNELPSLKPGHGYLWSPQWLGTFRKIHITSKRTFDSTATPKAGSGNAKRRELKALDLDDLKERMAATIERAKADDPKALRQRIAALERELQAAKEAAPAAEVEQVEVPVLSDADRTLLTDLFRQAVQASKDAKETSDRLSDAAAQVSLVREAIEEATETRQSPKSGYNITAPSARQNAGKNLTSKLPKAAAVAASNGHLPGAAQRILNALAELEMLRVAAPERVQVAFLAGYSNLNSKGFVNAIGSLRTGGLIAYPTDGRIALTDAGQSAAQYPKQLRTPEDVQNRVIDMLGGASGRLLRPLIDAYPEALTRDALAAASGYGNLNSKGFVNAIGRLRSLGFIDYPERGLVAAQPVLFLEN